jgi:hypothetical protein
MRGSERRYRPVYQQNVARTGAEHPPYIRLETGLIGGLRRDADVPDPKWRQNAATLAATGIVPGATG